jgi:hypothetical protein
MKCTISFNESIEDKILFKRCMKADDFAFAINDILKLRKKMERIFENQDNTNNDVFDGINEYSNELLEILNNYNINIDEYVM